MEDDNVACSAGPDEQAVTFVHLSEDNELACHEIIKRVFDRMPHVQRRAVVAWLTKRYSL